MPPPSRVLTYVIEYSFPYERFIGLRTSTLLAFHVPIIPICTYILRCFLYNYLLEQPLFVAKDFHNKHSYSSSQVPLYTVMVIPNHLGYSCVHSKVRQSQGHSHHIYFIDTRFIVAPLLVIALGPTSTDFT